MRKLIPWIALGLIVRIFLASTTIHPDIRGYNIAAYLISQKNEILTFYDYFRHLPSTDNWKKIYGDDIFIYPPLPYLTLGTFMGMFGGFYPWDLFLSLIDDYGGVLNHPQLPLLLTLLKFPYLFIDAVGLVLIYRFPGTSHEKYIRSLGWIFNPITLYSAYMLSQFDIFLAVSLAASLYFHHRGNNYISAIFLGISSAFKQFPLFLIPIFALHVGKTFRTRLGYFLLPFGIYLSTILPYLSSIGFRQYALMASQTDKIFFAKIPISGAFSISLFLTAYFYILWKSFDNSKRISLWAKYLGVFLAFYSLVHFHPQWFTWVSPLIVIFLLGRKYFVPTAALISLYFFTILLFEPSLNVGLFSPLFKTWMETPPAQIISFFYEPTLIGNILRSAFAATALYLYSQVQSCETKTLA